VKKRRNDRCPNGISAVSPKRKVWNRWVSHREVGLLLCVLLLVGCATTRFQHSRLLQPLRTLFRFFSCQPSAIG
jgi:hypothetical protein